MFEKYSKHFQDPSRDQLDRMDKSVRWCPNFELETLQFLLKELGSDILFLRYTSPSPSNLPKIEFVKSSVVHTFRTLFKN